MNKSGLSTLYEKVTEESMNALKESTIATCDVVMEKATAEQYAMSAFKKKYKYDPVKKTIVVDGETYKVDLDTKSKTMQVKDQNGNVETVIRSTAAEAFNSDPTIHIDKTFFKLKGSKQAERRDALLKHEIGHIKLHDPYMKNSTMSPSIIKDLINVQVTAAINQGRIAAETKDTVCRQLAEEMKQSIENANKKYNKEMIERDITRLIAKKYSKLNVNSHINAQEFEADRYAANRSSASAVKKGVREAYRYQRKQNIKDANKIKGQMSHDVSSGEYVNPDGRTTTMKDVNKQLDSSVKSLNSASKADMEQRGKALKDRELARRKNL